MSNEKFGSYEVYFWCPAVSPHLLPLFSAMLEHPRVRRTVYIGERRVEAWRQALGWEIEMPRGGEVIAGPSGSEVRDIVKGAAPDSIHIFYGIHWVPCIVMGLSAVIKYRRRFGIFSEPRVLEGSKGMLRLIHSLVTELKIRRHADFILAIGVNGPRWFALAGYLRERIFPSAYFLDLKTRFSADFPRRAATEPVSIAFVGRLEIEKGFHLFMQAVHLVKSEARFLVVGGGTLEPLTECGLPDAPRVEMVGVLPMSQVPNFLRSVDIVVLPSTSTNDGWGAVVSEALAAGAAVVVSSKVGASMCALQQGNGIVVSTNTPAEIASAIDELVNNGCLSSKKRRQRHQWAIAHLDQSAGASYIVSLFDHIYSGTPRPASFIDLAYIDQ